MCNMSLLTEPSSTMQCSTYDNVPSSINPSSGRSTPLTISSSTPASTRRSNGSSSLSPLSSSTHLLSRYKSPSPSRRTSSSTTSDSASPSTPSSTPRSRHASSKSSLSSYPSLDEDAIEDLLLKYTSNSSSTESNSTINFPSQLTSGLDFAAMTGSQKKINALLANWLPKTKNWISWLSGFINVLISLKWLCSRIFVWKCFCHVLHLTGKTTTLQIKSPPGVVTIS